MSADRRSGWGRSGGSDAFVNGTAPIANQQAIAAVSPRLSPEGFTGGGQIGYNYQVDRWLFGIEADTSYIGLRQGHSVTAPFPVGTGSFTMGNEVSTDWMVTVRPRVGYAVDRTLFYATGGLALTELNFASSFADTTGHSALAGLSKTKAGWTAGAGIEHALTNNWSAKIEYLYSDFGKTSVSAPVTTATGATAGVVTRDVDLKINTVRGGLNYHFGGSPIPRY